MSKNAKIKRQRRLKSKQKRAAKDLARVKRNKNKVDNQTHKKETSVEPKGEDFKDILSNSLSSFVCVNYYSVSEDVPPVVIQMSKLISIYLATKIKMPDIPVTFGDVLSCRTKEKAEKVSRKVEEFDATLFLDYIQSVGVEASRKSWADGYSAINLLIKKNYLHRVPDRLVLDLIPKDHEMYSRIDWRSRGTGIPFDNIKEIAKEAAGIVTRNPDTGELTEFKL